MAFLMLALGMGALASASAEGACPNAQFLTGASATLPDCRAYEQVSPTDKGGFAAYATQGLPAQTTQSGNALGFLSYEAFPGALGNTALYAGHISSRATGRWQTTELTPPVPTAESLKVYLVSYAFSEDMSQAVLQVPLVPLTPESTPGVFNLFLRSPSGGYSLVNDAKPAISAEEQCPSFLTAICFLIADVSSFAGASNDYSHILFESTAQLTSEAPETGIESLYESVGGHVKLVGILPDEVPAQGSTAGAGSRVEYTSAEQETDRRVEHAISKDGSQVVFQAAADGGTPAEEGQAGLTEVYDRIHGEQTIELSAPAPGATPPTSQPATFWAVSEDGTHVFFSSAARLTTQSTAGGEANGEDLYEYDFSKPLGERLTDLTVDAGDPSGAEVQGVVDIARDGSYVYFVAKGQLDGSEGEAGQPNLYVTHNGGPPTFVATLSGAGTCAFLARESADSCDWTPLPAELEAYVTPDGRHLAFMSTMSLPTANFPAGYDNVDQNTEEPDSEVYEYTAPSAEEEAEGGAGQLVCGSCAPSGERPVGSALVGGITQFEEAEVGRQPYSGISTPFYRVRALNEAGTRLFYTAPSPHANPYHRVYEYEQSGEGECATAGGCQYLISSPSGTESDQFLGISGDGGDVFFATASRLLPGDVDNLRDIYDARVDGGIAVASSTSGCENDCHQIQGAGPAPTLQGDATGSSGNVKPAAAAKPPTRAQKLAKALKVCRAKKDKHKRARCEASARHRYGPKKHGKAKSSNHERRAK